MKKTITLLFIFFCLLNAQIYAEISGYLYYKNKAGGNTARVMHDGKWWYKYDANGNRTIKAAAAQHEGNTVTINTTTEYWEYEWDYHNRLIKVQQFNAPDNASNVCVEYTYDALNRRIERISRTNTKPVVTHYAYGRNGTLTYQKKIVGEELTERTYVYLNNQIVAFVDKTPDGTEKTYYTVTDIQGTVTEVYDEEFKLVWKSDYAAFGIKAGETIDLIDFDGLYTGCDFDAETGLTYHWNRWRSEDGSTWLSQDPARDGLNWYGYAGQNPTNYTDTNGLYQHQIQDKYKMNQKNSPWVTNNETINGTELLISRYGCAIACVANLLSDKTNFTPSDINNKYVTKDGNVDWNKAGEDNGYCVDIHRNESFTREIMSKQMSDKKNTYKTAVKVKYNDAGDDHWVGVAGMTSLDGKDYLIITGSSVNDSYLGNGLSWNKETEKYGYTDTNNRQGKGWKVVNGQILVPVENTTDYINFTKPAPEGNKQNPSVRNDIKEF